MPLTRSSIFCYLFWFWFLAIMVLTYVPKLPDPKIEFEGEYLRLDYLGHLFFYGVLVVFFVLWKRKWIYNNKLKAFIFILIAGLALSVLNEVFQQFVPGRRYNEMDMVYNTAGTLAGIVASLWLIKHRN